MSVTIDEVQSEVVVGERGAERREPPEPAPETRKEELRAVVRELIREELERFLRTGARR